MPEGANGGREVLFAAPDVVTLDDDVEPAIRWATDSAYLQELTTLIELGATEPGGVRARMMAAP